MVSAQIPTHAATSATPAVIQRVRTLCDVNGHAITAPAAKPPRCPHSETPGLNSVYATFTATRARGARRSVERRKAMAIKSAISM